MAGHFTAFLLKAELKVICVMVNSSGMGLFARENETAKDLFAVGRVDAAGEVPR